MKVWVVGGVTKGPRAIIIAISIETASPSRLTSTRLLKQHSGLGSPLFIQLAWIMLAASHRSRYCSKIRTFGVALALIHSIRMTYVSRCRFSVALIRGAAVSRQERNRKWKASGVMASTTRTRLV
eukprot:scaffold152492_cov30-Tisochrysis_lutea.AAC.2